MDKTKRASLEYQLAKEIHINSFISKYCKQSPFLSDALGKLSYNFDKLLKDLFTTLQSLSTTESSHINHFLTCLDYNDFHAKLWDRTNNLLLTSQSQDILYSIPGNLNKKRN